MKLRYHLISIFFLVVGGLLFGVAGSFSRNAAPLPAGSRFEDQLVMGNAASEQAHGLTFDLSDVNAGQFGEPNRRLLPSEPQSWAGGKLVFKMKVDAEKQNYFTARFSGDEVTDNRLMLYVDGKQIGWRHLGEVDPLDFGTWEPAYNGRAFYKTLPLPLSLTQGKTEVVCEIRSSGKLWGYGNSFEQYQKPQATPSREIYRVYTHTDGFFVPLEDEKEGLAPARAPLREAPGVEVIQKIKDRVNHELDARLSSSSPVNQMQMVFLAKAYDVQWTHAHGNPQVIEQIVKGLDNLYAAYLKNPKLAEAELSTWNPSWNGLGPSGQVISLRQKELSPYLDETVDDGQGGKVTRRAAWTKALLETRDWHRLNRRHYTNQTMLNDLNGIYFANRGVQVLEPAKAFSEQEARRYLYESVGLEPWRDSDAGGQLWNVGPDYWQLTAKGLSKELGYVGTYGEIIDLVADIYNGTRLAPGQPGDEKIKAQLVKVTKARAAMRHPALDAQGNQVMRLEQIVGWRDNRYPGEVVYAQRGTRDASALQAAAITLDPQLVGYAQQMLEDNQFFQSELHAMDETAMGLRITMGRLETPDEYELIKALPRNQYKLPMSQDQPDFVFSDEEDGVVAIKNGSDILYVSLYWRARYGINHLARVHYITPQFDRIAIVAEETEFEPNGNEFIWPDWTNMAFGNGGLKYPDATIKSAYAGTRQPIAKIPHDDSFKPGNESPYAGRGDFYKFRYGPYLIGLNMSQSKTFELRVPEGKRPFVELVSKQKRVAPGTSLKIGPRTTAVLYLPEEKR